jgi:hypothetical protein
MAIAMFVVVCLIVVGLLIWATFQPSETALSMERKARKEKESQDQERKSDEH